MIHKRTNCKVEFIKIKNFCSAKETEKISLRVGGNISKRHIYKGQFSKTHTELKIKNKKINYI